MAELILNFRWRFKNVPFIKRRFAANEFERFYNEAVEIINDHIEETNALWDKIVGDSDYDPNDYNLFFRRQVQPYLDLYNITSRSAVGFRLMKNCNIEGFLKSDEKACLYREFLSQSYE